MNFLTMFTEVNPDKGTETLFNLFMSINPYKFTEVNPDKGTETVLDSLRDAKKFVYRS